MIESWMPVPGYTKYSVSDRGNVRRNSKLENSKKGLLCLIPSGNGYLQVSLSENNCSKVWRVHQLVARAFLGPQKGNLEVNHKDGDGTNNLVMNLEYVTPSGNRRHCIDVLGKGTVRGSQHGMSKLTEEKVLKLLIFIKQGWPQYKVAKKFGVCQRTVSDIVLGRLWDHCTGLERK